MRVLLFLLILLPFARPLSDLWILSLAECIFLIRFKLLIIVLDLKVLGLWYVVIESERVDDVVVDVEVYLLR